jgi:hypothetical protein
MGDSPSALNRTAGEAVGGGENLRNPATASKQHVRQCLSALAQDMLDQRPGCAEYR